MQTYRSFGEQGSHYYQRPHSSVPNSQIEDESAWKGSELANSPESWCYQLTETDVDEIKSAVSNAVQQNLTLEDITRVNFKLPTLSPRIHA